MDSIKTALNADSLKHLVDSLKNNRLVVPAPQSDSLYIVLSIVIIIWTGIFLYLYNLDKRLKIIESESK